MASYPKTDRPVAERLSPRALHLEWQQNVSSFQTSGRDHQCCQGALAFVCISLVHQMKAVRAVDSMVGALVT